MDKNSAVVSYSACDMEVTLHGVSFFFFAIVKQGSLSKEHTIPSSRLRRFNKCEI